MKHRLTFLLLLFVYALATWLPGPGRWLLALSYRLDGLELGVEGLGVAQALLAVLLFSAGLSSKPVSVQAMVSFRHRFAMLAAICWLLPIVTATLVSWFMWQALDAPSSVMLGILIVGAMPVANSSVGWSTITRGNTALSIGLLLVVTSLAPLVSPFAIRRATSVFGDYDATLLTSPWDEGLAMFFLVWVLVPVLLGFLLSYQLGESKSPKLVTATRMVSLAALLALNYLNGTTCLPELKSAPAMLMWPILAAVTLLMSTFACWRGLLLVLRQLQILPRDFDAERQSTMLAVVMRNTGAALVFAGAALPSFALVGITIIAYTMIQHLFVGLLAIIYRPEEKEAQADVGLGDGTNGS